MVTLLPFEISAESPHIPKCYQIKHMRDEISAMINKDHSTISQIIRLGETYYQPLWVIQITRNFLWGGVDKV